jgi:hypothetical protein
MAIRLASHPVIEWRWGDGMTPSEYVSIIVAPTVREYLEAMGDQRRGYLACVVTFHVTDWLAKAEGNPNKAIIDCIRSTCASAFDVVEGIA